MDIETHPILEEVRRILNLEGPYSEIKNFRSLETRIETSIKTALSSQKEKIREKLSSVREEIEKAGDCTMVQTQLLMIDSCRKDAYEKIDSEKWIIRQRPKKAPYGKEPETPADPGTSPASKRRPRQ
jgi:hypothetical protein